MIIFWLTRLGLDLVLNQVWTLGTGPGLDPGDPPATGTSVRTCVRSSSTCWLERGPQPLTCQGTMLALTLVALLGDVAAVTSQWV